MSLLLITSFFFTGINRLFGLLHVCKCILIEVTLQSMRPVIKQTVCDREKIILSFLFRMSYLATKWNWNMSTAVYCLFGIVLKLYSQ